MDLNQINQTINTRGFASLTQAQKDYYLSQGGSTSSGVSSLTAPITSTSLQSTPSPNLPPPPTTTNYTPQVTGGTATLASIGTQLDKAYQDALKIQEQTNQLATQQTQQPQPTQQSYLDQFKGYLNELAGVKLPSATETRTNLESQFGITEKQNAFNTAQQGYLSAKSEFDVLNAQIQGLQAEAAAIPEQIQVESEGRGRTAAGAAVLTADALRKNALKQLPLQTQAMVSQANMANALGNAQLAQSILSQAQGRVDSLFQTIMDDAKTKYNYQINVIDKIYDFLDKQQQRAIDERKNTLATNNSQYNSFVSDVRSYSSSAIQNGQGGLATQLGNLIAHLDPNSPSFAQDYQRAQQQFARLTGQIRIQQPNSPLSDIPGLTPEQSSDPFIQKLLATKGGKALTDTPLQQINKGLTVLGQLGALQTNISNTKTGPILGAFKGINPWDTNAQTIKAQLNAIVPNLARGIYGEVGVLTDNDIKTYSKTIGNLTSTNDVNNAIMYITLDLIGKSIKNTLEVQAAGGRDVSRFVDIYTNMEATKNSILQSLPQNTSLASLGITSSDENLFNSVVGGQSTSQTTSGGFFSNIWKGLMGQ